MIRLGAVQRILLGGTPERRLGVAWEFARHGYKRWFPNRGASRGTPAKEAYLQGFLDSYYLMNNAYGGQAERAYLIGLRRGYRTGQDS